MALDLLRAGQVDVAVVFRYDDTIPDDIRATHLFDDPMYLLSLEPGQALAGKPRLRLDRGLPAARLPCHLRRPPDPPATAACLSQVDSRIKSS